MLSIQLLHVSFNLVDYYISIKPIFFLTKFFLIQSSSFSFNQVLSFLSKLYFSLTKLFLIQSSSFFFNRVLSLSVNLLSFIYAHSHLINLLSFIYAHSHLINLLSFIYAHSLSPKLYPL